MSTREEVRYTAPGGTRMRRSIGSLLRICRSFSSLRKTTRPIDPIEPTHSPDASHDPEPRARPNPTIASDPIDHPTDGTVPFVTALLS
jgi:hypothetical protein